jgi:hypothetical protein
MSAIAARMRAERKQKAIRSHKKGGKPQQLAATLNRSPLDWGAEGERSIGYFRSAPCNDWRRGLTFSQKRCFANASTDANGKNN